MEQLGAMFEESEFMTQLLGEFFPETEVRSNLWPAQTSANVALIVDEDNFVYSSDPSIFNVCFSPQETSTYSSSDCDGDIANFLLSSSQGTDCQLGASGQCYYDLVDFGFEEDENMSSTAYVCTGRMVQLDEGSNQLKDSAKFEAEVGESVCNSAAFHGTKLEIQVLDEAADSRKRPHNAEAQKSKRNVKPRKSKKVAEITNTDEDKSDCGGLLRQTSSSNCLLDDDSVGGAISNLTAEESSFPPPSGNGKARASRGSATDPQSLYARKRREKINERLRILQGLVPNGTKVDISTMLDEAVQYVKFLQLQIKLLSSDDMWMYAPLAYNGMDLGLDLKI